LDSYFNLILDRICRINWILLVPHFPEENEENQSDFVGKNILKILKILSKKKNKIESIPY